MFYFASNQIVKDLRRRTSDPPRKTREGKPIRCRPRKPKWTWPAKRGKTTSINFWGIWKNYIERAQRWKYAVLLALQKGGPTACLTLRHTGTEPVRLYCHQL